MKALLLVASVACAHYGYYLWPKGSADRQWAFYVATHALVVVALLVLLLAARRLSNLSAAAVFACWWGAIESGQAAACGALRWGSIPKADLCVEQFGASFFAGTAAAALATVLVFWRRRGST